YDRIAATTRQDWFETYNRLFTGHLGPDGLNTGKWLLHEESAANRFRRHTDPGPPARPDAPEPPHNAAPLAAVPHRDTDRTAWEPGPARRPDTRAQVREPAPGPDTRPRHPAVTPRRTAVTPQRAAAVENLRRGLPVLAAGTALTPQALNKVADDVIASVTAGHGGGRAVGREEDAGLCVTLLEGFVRAVAPGVRLRPERDDLALGGADAARHMVDRLRPVDTWQALADSVRQAAVAHPAGEGAPGKAYAMVYGQRRTGIGHALAAASDGQTVWFVDLRAAPGKRVSQTEPSWSPLYARAAVFTPAGELAPAAQTQTPQHPAESHSTSRALLDPPADHRYGGIGAEVEARYPLTIEEPDGRSIDARAGSVLANHYPTGFKIVVDTRRFWEGPDGNLQSVVPPGQEGTKIKIPEIVTPPFAVLPGDIGRLSVSSGLDMLDHVRSLLGRVDEYRQPLRLSQILPEGKTNVLGQRKGWFITELGEKTTVLLSPDGANHPAYSQITVGIPAHRLLDILEFAALGLPEPLAHIFETARRFGRGVAANYASELAGRPVEARDVDLLVGIEGVTEIWGYAWLLFTHVAAYPLTLRLDPSSLMKNMLPAASRAPFSKIHALLTSRARGYFDRNHDLIRDHFVLFLQWLLNTLGIGSSGRSVHDNGILNEIIEDSGVFLSVTS
ncbi:hypothetical protein ACFWA5_48095, partial [Streptomyces mirabilis]